MIKIWRKNCNETDESWNVEIYSGEFAVGSYSAYHGGGK
jgi:hypothetical protein